MTLIQQIDKNWQFKQISKADDTYLPVSQFPTVVHLDLLHHGQIPDPFMDDNAYHVQWIGEEEWVYKTTFDCKGCSGKRKCELVFEGLHTHSVITLNGQEILRTNNMFLQYRYDATKLLSLKEMLWKLSLNQLFSLGSN
jgi:beta-mannosidase